MHHNLLKNAFWEIEWMSCILTLLENNLIPQLLPTSLHVSLRKDSSVLVHVRFAILGALVEFSEFTFELTVLFIK